MARDGLRILAVLAATVLLAVAPADAQPSAFPLGARRRAAAHRSAAHGRLRLLHGDQPDLLDAHDPGREAPDRPVRGREVDACRRDGLTWTFKLRDNLVFHNGRKADANDVKYSLTPAGVAGLPLAELLPAALGRRRLRGGEQEAGEGARGRAGGRPPDRGDPPAVAAQGRPGDAAVARLDRHHREGGGRGRRRQLGGGPADRHRALEAEGVGRIARGSSSTPSPSSSGGSRRSTGWRCRSCRSRRPSWPCTRTASWTSSWFRWATTRASRPIPGGARR